MIRVRRPFVLAGIVPPSKSWLNRALILRSLFPDLRIVEWEPSELDGEDVAHLLRALTDLANGKTEFDIGESGTGIRFLIARLSCERGVFKVRGTKRLLERPHASLFAALEKVGTTVTRIDDAFEVRAQGWPAHDVEIEIDSSESSQFASALKLAASTSSHGFKLTMTGAARSLGYLEMTEAMIQHVASGRKVLVAEADASSIATLACIAVASSHVMRHIAVTRLASQSLPALEMEVSENLGLLREQVERTRQPDRVVFEHLEKMRTADGLKAIEADLGGAPDLFPCVAALSAFANGTSKFFGAPHLRLKESDRIQGVARLFDLVGISYRERDDGMEVDGITPVQAAAFAKRRRQGLPFIFDPLQDHRLAFAAAVLAAGGVPIEVTNRGVVAKSLPMFWTMIEGDAPRIGLIGHRGSGKTEAAKRWAFEMGARAMLIDLDREIERLAGKSTQEIIETQGEVEFRWFERQAWREVDVETRNSIGAVIVSCGAGFDPSQIDDSWTRVWIRRVTDHDGRIFTDRPRLDRALDPLTESKTRVAMREPRFAAHADRVFEIGEGPRDPSERAWIGDLFDQDLSERAELSDETSNLAVTSSTIAMIGGTVTMMPHHNVAEMSERLLRWGVSRLEIRDDLWPSSKEVAAWDFFETLPSERAVISFRNPSETEFTIRRIEQWLSRNEAGLIDRLAIDWPIEWAEQLPAQISDWIRTDRIELIASIHEVGAKMTTQILADAEKTFRGAVIKAALEIEDFKTLRTFHQWMLKSPKTRVFLPMTSGSLTNSAVGAPRWQWYRTWLGARAPLGLNFWREDNGSSLDQPTFSQWWRRRRFQSKDFAAVLGDPVLHSRTPLEHEAFFRSHGLPVFAIPLGRADAGDGLSLLGEMGLKAAAVTAPLKEEIAAGQACNTIFVRDARLLTTSTDNVGFGALWESTLELRTNWALTVGADGTGVVVWGGGGVLVSLRDVLPGASYYSASKAELRSGGIGRAAGMAPEIVVWAAGETRGAWPATWKPRLVIDLSYTENSMGRAIALESGARYVSGLTMFEAQAAAQREFWKKNFSI